MTAAGQERRTERDAHGAEARAHRSTPLRMVCAFPEMLPMLIHKDVGQIPYHLARELGWKCELAYWTKDSLELIEPPDFAHWVRLASLGVFRSRAERTWTFLKYLRSRSKEIDVLLLYHLTSESLLYAIAYKAFNRHGVAVLKLDMDHRGLAAFHQHPGQWKRRALMQLFATAPLDFVTIETERMHESLRPFLSKMGHELHVFSVGIDCSDPVDIEHVLSAKKDIVLTAGRLGLEQKHNELLVEAIERLTADVLGDWQFWFVGSRTPSFDERLERLRRERPDLSERIVTRDFVASREELADVYGRAKVYCLTSRWESFAIVLAESAYHGCYLVSTDVGAAWELTQRGECGAVIPVEDVGRLAQTLEGIMTGSIETKDAARRAHENVKARYCWPDVVRKFAERVQEHRKVS